MPRRTSGTSEEFPGPWPIRNFKRYIHYHTYPLNLFYNAYPQATVRDINAANEVDRCLGEFRASIEVEKDADKFEEKFRAFEDNIVDHLTSSGHERMPSTLLSRPQNLRL